MAISAKLLGQRLKAIRKQAGVTQEVLAERANLSVSQISKIERGAKNLTIVRLSTICNALNIEIETILGAANTPSNTDYNKQFGAIASGCRLETVHAMLDICSHVAAIEARLRKTSK